MPKNNKLKIYLHNFFPIDGEWTASVDTRDPRAYTTCDKVWSVEILEKLT